MDDHSDNFAIVFAAMGVSILSMLYTLLKIYVIDITI